MRTATRRAGTGAVLGATSGLGRDSSDARRAALTGTFVRAQELRGGAALILAALVAAGTTVLEGYSFVRRGYEHICQDLEQLGAAVKRIQE